MLVDITLDEVSRIAIAMQPVGSRVTCNPPPSDTDIDYLVLIDNVGASRLFPGLFAANFDMDGSSVCDPADHLDNEGTFQSFSKGELNLIITEDPIFYRKFLAATAVAKRLNLLLKEDRIALFQAVLYANPDCTAQDGGGIPNAS